MLHLGKEARFRILIVFLTAYAAVVCIWWTATYTGDGAVPHSTSQSVTSNGNAASRAQWVKGVESRSSGTNDETSTGARGVQDNDNGNAASRRQRVRDTAGPNNNNGTSDEAAARAERVKGATLPNSGTSDETSTDARAVHDNDNGNVASRGQRAKKDGTSDEAAARAERVKGAIAASWGAYERFALGADELSATGNAAVYWDAAARPMVTLVDSLDTLFLAGLRPQFARAVAHLKRHFSLRWAAPVSVFEVTIRVLGGLLSAHALTGDAEILALAVQVAGHLRPAYAEKNLRDGKFPRQFFDAAANASTGPTWLAELGSVQLEYRYLSRATGDPSHEDAVLPFLRRAFNATGPLGLLGQQYKEGTGFVTKVGTGALSDSYYEYLLKMHLLTGGSEPEYLDMYRRAAETLVGFLVQPRRGTRSERYVAAGNLNADGSRLSLPTKPAAFEHLSCFLPGLLALGAGPVGGRAAARHRNAAAGVAEFCVNLYIASPTGLAPDEVSVDPRTGAVAVVGARYRLRPETAESLFYLWRTTRDPVYREWGWRLFVAIERHCRVCADCDVSGYSEVADVREVPAAHTGHMESYFIGETLKYLYLLFSDDAVLDLDCWVFNTEGHPFPKFAPNANIPDKCKKV
ncbi:Mannosyl-oligosaccharide 1 [Diplonema papillatum]|nr:Mannosyl-oligosaccharide 1 [Diplonema papillatum]